MKNKQGFEVVCNSQVYIAKGTPSKSAPRDEVVSLVREMWNKVPEIKKLRPHIKKLSVQRTISNTDVVSLGSYNVTKSKVIIRDHHAMRVNDYKETMYHEIVGHAFWYWAAKWRNEEWKEFNDFVSKLRPINEYVRRNATKWKQIRRAGMYTLYEDEQHSAAVELFNYHTGDAFHIPRLNEDEIKDLKEKYDKLHY